MEHENIDHTSEMDLKCIEMFGITYDFFNEVPLDTDNENEINSFIDRCKNDLVKTYSQRFSNSPRILQESDRQVVDILDQLITEAIEAAKVDDRKTVKSKIQKVRSFRK